MSTANIKKDNHNWSNTVQYFHPQLGLLYVPTNQMEGKNIHCEHLPEAKEKQTTYFYFLA